MTKSHLIIKMLKCKNCFYSTACMSFEELNVKGEEAACENYLDQNQVIVLPCPIGTTVYEKSKNCEKCPNYEQTAYSDCVGCSKENDLFDFHMFSNNEDCEECNKYIETHPLKFHVGLVNRFGKDIFLTENIVILNIPKNLTHLAGYRYGKTIFNSVKDKMVYENPITFVLPDHVTHIGSSFIHGFFEEIMNHWCVHDIYTKMHWVSSVPNFENVVKEELF